ncbi:MAG: nickel transporter [Planctomycetes bacterium]|nr:nickel transporter [Planctomycetota bacterium]
MRILPVIDLLGGQVVHAVRGERAGYRPLRTHLINGSDPADLAAALRSQFGWQSIYVADLDAIQGRSANRPQIDQLLAAQYDVWLDAGLTSLDVAVQWSELEVSGHRLRSIIVGLESLRSARELRELVLRLSPERVVFSLDLRDGQPILGADDWEAQDPRGLVRTIASAGIRRWIVLDLASVGGNAGTPTLEICASLRQQFPDAQITSGGGVRDAADLRQLQRSGCDYALVATAIYHGGMTPVDVAPFERSAVR